MSNEYNPIRSVDGHEVSCPASFVWGLQDVSASNAGRTEAVVMDKMRIGQVVKIDLSWKYLSTAEASKVLKAFNPEYIMVEYLDPLVGTYITAEFYVGDRSAPMYNCKLDLWENIAFSITGRNGVDNGLSDQ